MRRVRTLHLSAPNDALLRRGEILLEDALHTASLPEADGGLLWLVRSLSVGRIDPRGSSASLALKIEQQLRQWGALARHGSDPAAVSAAVVYFLSTLEAHIFLAQQLSRGEPIQGWFWSVAVPSWQPGTPAALALRQILFATFSLPGGVAAVAQFVESLVQAQAGDQLLASLSPQDGTQLLQACGWPAAAVAPADPTGRREEPLLAASWRSTLSDWTLRWGAGDGRVVWLAAIALVARNPSRSAAPTLLDHAQAVIQALHPMPADPAVPPATEVPLASGSSATPQGWLSSPDMEGPAFGQGPPSAQGTGAPPQRGDSQLAPVPAPEADHPAADAADSPGMAEPPPLLWSGLPPVNTAFAGFPFLIPLLRQLGIEAWLACHPLLLEWDWPRLLLLRTAAQLGIPPEDPVLRGLVPDGLEAAVPTAVLKSLCRHWSKTLRRWSLGPGRLTLATLVRRPGAVVSHRTHLDLYFNHRQADIRVRRLGLDLDPGWVSWLGLVVQVHYLTGGGSDGG